MRNRVLMLAALAALLLPGTAAVAQVAAPNLNPGALLQTAQNPGVLQWSGPSRVSVGYLDGYTRTYSAVGALLSDVSVAGPFFQARAVGEVFSAGAEQLRLSVSPVPGSGDYTQTQLAVAMGLGDAIAVGIGQDGVVDDTAAVTREDTLAIAGVAVRAGGRYYAGVAAGSETHQETPYLEAKRDVLRFGVGYHTRTQTDGFHAEVFHHTRAARSKENPPAAPVVEDEQKGDVLVVEWVVSQFYLGLALNNERVTNATVPGSSFDEERRIFALGWVPAQGLAVVAHMESRERSIDAGNSQDRTRNRVTLVWSF
jgi:hypothetical protein